MVITKVTMVMMMKTQKNFLTPLYKILGLMSYVNIQPVNSPV